MSWHNPLWLDGTSYIHQYGKQCHGRLQEQYHVSEQKIHLNPHRKISEYPPFLMTLASFLWTLWIHLRWSLLNGLVNRFVNLHCESAFYYSVLFWSCNCYISGWLQQIHPHTTPSSQLNVSLYEHIPNPAKSFQKKRSKGVNCWMWANPDKLWVVCYWRLLNYCFLKKTYCGKEKVEHILETFRTPTQFRYF